jgi:hypothetical protein
MKIYTKKDFHNPENLTCQQVGDKHRLLLHEEIDGRFGCEGQDIAEFWSIPERVFNGGDLVGARYSFSVYRVPLATPLPDGAVLTSNECCWADDAVQPEPQEEWAAEKAAFAAGEEIEWRPDSGSYWREDRAPIPAWNHPGFQFRVKLPKAYVAGPMSGHADYNFPAFFAASEFLEQQGYTAINPAKLDCDAGYPLERLKLLTPEEFQEFLKGAMKRDLEAIQSCDALVLLPGWEKSKGARAERAVAEWAGLRVGYLWMETGDGFRLTWEEERQHDPKKPQPDPDGWIPHVSSDLMPCNGDTIVDVKFNCGKVNVGNVASYWGWRVGDCDYNIASWRPHQPQPKQPYNSDERAEWDVEQPKFHPNDPKGLAGAKKAPMHLLPPLPLMRLAWAMGHGAAKYGVNNFLDAKVLASTYIGAIGRHWAQFSSGEDNDNDSGLSHIALLAANCMILMAAADAGTLIDDRRKQ